MLRLGTSLAAVIVMGSCVFIAAGCGGSSDEPLTKAEFVKQGNAICKQAETERGKIFAEVSNGFDRNKDDLQALQAELILKTIPTYERAAQRLDELEPPAALSETVDALVAAMEEAGEQVKASPQAAIFTNAQFKKANQKAKQLQLKSCLA